MIAKKTPILLLLLNRSLNKIKPTIDETITIATLFKVKRVELSNPSV
jgi:hypothetical protein